MVMSRHSYGNLGVSMAFQLAITCALTACIKFSRRLYCMFTVLPLQPYGIVGDLTVLRRQPYGILGDLTVLLRRSHYALIRTPSDGDCYVHAQSAFLRPEFYVIPPRSLAYHSIACVFNSPVNPGEQCKIIKFEEKTSFFQLLDIHSFNPLVLADALKFPFRSQ